MEFVASEFEFIDSIIRVETSYTVAFFMKRYGLVDDDFERVLSQAYSPADTQKLSSLLKAQQLKAFSSDQISCSPIGVLTNLNKDYLPLAISCGQTFVHHLELTALDVSVFHENAIKLYDSRKDGSPHGWGVGRTNVVRSWALIDAGITKPEDVLSSRFVTAARVIIYDRFFNESALLVLEDTLRHAVSIRRSKLPAEIMIVHERSSLSHGQVSRALGGFLDVPVQFVGSSRVGTLSVHDRMIQIDRSYTYVFTAGDYPLQTGMRIRVLETL